MDIIRIKTARESQYKPGLTLVTEVKLTLFRLGFLRVAQLEGGRGGGGGGVPAAYNSKIINDNEMKFCGVVKDDSVKIQWTNVTLARKL